MAYVKPLVQVYQEYESLSATSASATLNTCVIGPCYHKVDISSTEEADLLPALAGELASTGSLASVEIPGMKAGALVQEESVVFLIRDPMVIMSASDAAIASVSDATLTFTSVNYPTGVAVGDYITVVDADDGDAVVADTFKVLAVDASAYTVTLNRKVVTSSTNLEAKWMRPVDDFTLPYDDSAVDVDVVTEEVSIAGLTREVDSADKVVCSGNVFVGHTSLRQDVDVLGSAADTSEVIAKLGEIEPYNTLAFGVSIALANSSNSVYFIGVDSDDLEGYTAAKDRLETLSDIYCLVPLTQNAAYLNVFGAHATQFSLPEVGEWRICLGNTPLPEEILIASGTATVGEDLSSDPRVLDCAEGDFLTNAVNAGYTARLYSSATEYTDFTVDSIVSEDSLVVSADLTGFTVGSSYELEVIRIPDISLQAQAVSDTSSSFNNSRFVHVWPDVCTVDGEDLPGYFLCCAVGGMVSGLPSHQGLTRLSVAGIDSITHSGDYFNSAQLDVIADGGTFIFEQLNPSAPPFVRHQLTTDRSTLEFQELSFVKNYDYVSYILKDVLDNFLGQYNVTPTTLATLETAVRATLESLKLYSVPKIGSPILAYDESITATQLEDQKDRVEIYAYVEFPYPLNTIGMHLVSTSI